MSPYNYAFNNPVIFNDPSGMEGEEYGGKPVEYIQRIQEEGVYNVKLGYDKNTGIHSIELSSEIQEAVEITGSKTPSWYNNLGFNDQGYYRNEYSEGGFSDFNNYVRFLDNAVAAIWNTGVEIVQSFKNFSFEVLKQEIIGIKDDVIGYYDYYTQTNIAQQYKDTKEAFISTFSNIKTYENIVPMLLLKRPTTTLTAASYEFKI